MSGLHLGHPLTTGILQQRWGFPQGLWKQKQKKVAPAVVSFAKQGTETGNTCGPGRPARPPDAKICHIFFFRCRSASESVFAGILDQIFQGFIDSRNVFSDAEELTFWESNI